MKNVKLKIVPIAVFLLFTIVPNGYSDQVSVLDTKNIGTPFMRTSIEAGFANPFMGIGANVEFTNLFGVFQLKAYGHFGVLQTIDRSYRDISAGGEEIYASRKDSYKDTNYLPLSGFNGLSGGARLGVFLSRNEVMESREIWTGSSLVRSGAYSDVYSVSYFNTDVPVNLNHLLVVDFSMEPIGNAEIKEMPKTLGTGTETSVVLTKSYVQILKLLYQFESNANYRVEYASVGSDDTETNGDESYFKFFIGPTAPIDFSGVGFYAGIEWDNSWHFCTRLEGGCLFLPDGLYIPFRINMGFFF